MLSVGVSPHDEFFSELLGQTSIKICFKKTGLRVTKVYSYRKSNKLTHNCFSITYIVPSNGRPSLLSRLAKKAGSVGNTRLLPHANMPLVPMNCFLCRVDYALEENVLTEQM